MCVNRTHDDGVTTKITVIHHGIKIDLYNQVVFLERLRLIDHNNLWPNSLSFLLNQI